MSRIGRVPIKIPQGVDVEFPRSGLVRVKGPKGTLEQSVPAEITLERDSDTVVALRPSDEGRHRSLHGLTRTLVANMVEGVTNGYSKSLEVHGTGYRATMKGSGLELLLGYSHPIDYPAPEGITFNVETVEKVLRITVSGADKALVGQVAAEIRSKRKPEPYKQKGVRYVGEYVRKKAGKTAAAK